MKWVGEGERTAKKAWVFVVYEDVNKKKWNFQRTDVCYPLSSHFLLTDCNRTSTTGASEYKLNKKVVTYTAYSTTLTSHNILVKAPNFLVFQGDVEAVASQSPVALSKLVDEISGSLELKAEYDKCKEETERATDNSGKSRDIAGEHKTYKEQKG